MDILLLGVALQQGLFGLAWWVAGHQLGLSRRAARHWAQGALLTAVSLLLIQQHGIWPDLLTITLSSLLTVLAFLGLRRGTQMFLGLPTTDREHLAVLALALVLAAIGTGGVWLPKIGLAVLIAWTLVRTAIEAWFTLRRIEGRGVAWMVSLPFALLGAVYLTRIGLSLFEPAAAVRPLNERSAFNEWQLLMFMAFGLVLNLVGAFTVARRLVSRLQQLSMRDPLTKLLNRRGLTIQMAREAGRLRRHREAYALLAIDADHFKAINDRHGHAAGDAALVGLAEVLRGNARNIDQIARVGGEEFCVLLPFTDRAGAMVAAERMRSAVQWRPWPDLSQPLTVSIGVAVADREDESAEAVMERADAALYEAKRLGRNRVVLAPPAGSAKPAPAAAADVAAAVPQAGIDGAAGDPASV